MTKIRKFIKDCITDFKKVPSWLVALSAVAVVLMNILAYKELFPTEWISMDGGFLISWIMFLVMDIVTQRYGGKASFAVTIFNVIVAASMSGPIGWFSKEAGLVTSVENSILVVLVSLLAYLVSGGVDILSNVTIGKWMNKSKVFNGEDGKRSVKGFFIYFSRAYASTFLSQIADNIVFQFIAYNFLFTWFYNPQSLEGVQPGAMLGDGGAQLTILIGALAGAVAELIMELAFAPVGYLAITKKKTEAVVEKV